MHIDLGSNTDNTTFATVLRTKFFENHSSIFRIKEHYINNQATMPFLSLTTLEEVKKHLAAINPSKAVGFDNIPPKLVKVTAETLGRPLWHAINNKIVFPSPAKIAIV